MSQTPFVAINSFNNLSEAYIVKGLLEHNDIPAIIEDNSLNSIYPTVGGFGAIRIKVHEDHVAAAHSLLTNLEPIHSDKTPRTQNIKECPACGSAEVFKYRSFLGWTFGKSRPDVDGDYRRCAQCDHRWRGAGDRETNKFMLVLLLCGCTYTAVWVLLWIIDFLRYF